MNRIKTAIFEIDPILLGAFVGMNFSDILKKWIGGNYLSALILTAICLGIWTLAESNLERRLREASSASEEDTDPGTGSTEA